MKPRDEQEFTRGHFDPNAVVHMRYGDAHDENGKRMLYLDEIQSDWHQKGRDEGYLSGDAAAKKAEAQAKLPEATARYERQQSRLGDFLAPNGTPYPSSSAIKKHAGLMLLDPDNLTTNEENIILDEMRHGTHRASLWGTSREEGLGSKSPAEGLRHFQKYAHEYFGPNYRDEAMELNNALQQSNDLEQAASGNLVPDAPWKDSSDWAKLAIKRAMRTAADYGYDGVALSPGWVQSRRWGGNEGHVGLYDKIFAGALEKAAKEAGLKPTRAHIKQLQKHAEDAGHGGPGNYFNSAHAVYMTPEAREKIRKEGFKLFKRGGWVKYRKVRKLGGRLKPTAKDARRAVIIARGQPTEAQKEAGNYKKDHVKFQGLDISIENRKGTERSGVGPDGKRWSVKMPADYGYIKGTEGADGDHVDAYIGPDKSSTHVFLINQHDHRSGRFDEHKVVLGCKSEREAADLYASGFSDGKGRDRLGSMESMSIDAFKHWLKRGDTTKKALGIVHKYLAHNA